MALDRNRSFRDRLVGREHLLGTFLKTPSPHATEILGDVGFDFVVVDCEHAPFDRGDVDVITLAGRAANIDVLVRVQSASAAEILNVLDCGATGVLVPHVADAPTMRAVLSAARYKGGSRGFSNSSRAGGYGRLGFRDHISQADASVAVIAMIEDLEALERLDAIFAVEGLTAAFIGRGDLSAHLGAESTSAPDVRKVVRQIADAARRQNIPLIAHVGDVDSPDVRELQDLGVTGLVCASDQGLMRQAALASVRRFVKAS